MMRSHRRPARSIRSSCNRCRSSKLKCTPSSDCGTSSACQRCVRAKTECVFEQRACNKHGLRRPRRSISPLFEEFHQETSSRNGIYPLSSPPSSVESNYTAKDPGSPQFDGILISKPNLAPTPKAFSTTSPSSAVAEYDSNQITNEWREEVRATNSYQNIDMIESFTWADDNTTWSDFAQDFPMSQTQEMPTCLNPWDDIEFGQTILQDFDTTTVAEKVPTSPVEEGERNASLQRELSTLLGEMQSSLQMLNTYYNSESSSLEDALSNYPIGDTLYLLRRYCDLQGQACETDSSDMVVPLIVVTCYITIMRVLDTLFGHLEQYLARITAVSAKRPHNSSAEDYRGLKLRELTDATFIYVRVRGALTALKETLKGMDLPIGISNLSSSVVQEKDGIINRSETKTFQDYLVIHMAKERALYINILNERKILSVKVLRLEQHLDYYCAADGGAGGRKMPEAHNSMIDETAVWQEPHSTR